MKPKPPPPPPLPPAVPPDLLIVAAETKEDFEARVKRAVAGDMRASSNTTQLTPVAGVVLISQAFVRDPVFDLRVRTRESTQATIDLQNPDLFR